MYSLIACLPGSFTLTPPVPMKKATAPVFKKVYSKTVESALAVKDVNQIITDRIVERLEKGVIPWVKPWSASGLASNYITRKPYRGINALLLNSTQFELPYFMTFKQAAERGGKIRKGAKAEMVTYWNYLFFHKQGGGKLTPLEARILPAATVKRVAYLKYYNVFNVADVEGVDLDLPKAEVKPLPERLEQCDAIIEGLPQTPRVTFGGNRACYIPALDALEMPNREDFISPEFYYKTFFHEIIHWTGHEARLNRRLVGSSADIGSYSREELIAELGAAFLCNHAGISGVILENTTAYIQGWLSVLKNDKTLIVEAAGLAQKATDYLLQTVPGYAQEEELLAA